MNSESKYIITFVKNTEILLTLISNSSVPSPKQMRKTYLTNLHTPNQEKKQNTKLLNEVQNSRANHVNL